MNNVINLTQWQRPGIDYTNALDMSLCHSFELAKRFMDKLLSSAIKLLASIKYYSVGIFSPKNFHGAAFLISLNTHMHVSCFIVSVGMALAKLVQAVPVIGDSLEKVQSRPWAEPLGKCLQVSI